MDILAMIEAFLDKLWKVVKVVVIGGPSLAVLWELGRLFGPAAKLLGM